MQRNPGRQFIPGAINEYHKNYREINKDTIKIKHTEKQTCGCGGSFMYGNTARHMKTTLHTNWIEMNK